MLEFSLVSRLGESMDERTTNQYKKRGEGIVLVGNVMSFILYM